MFINLKCRTEYSFKRTYGPIKEVIAACGDSPCVGIADNNSTFGHVQFYKQCKKANKKPILGVQLKVVRDLEKVRHQDSWTVTLLARNLKGLQEIYRINSKSFEQMYYFPRTTIGEINDLSDNVIVLSGSNPDPSMSPPILYHELSPGYHFWNTIARKRNLPNLVLTSDVFFPTVNDRIPYEMIDDNPDRKTTPQHILSYEEALALGLPLEAISNTRVIADACEEYDLPVASMVHFSGKDSLETICRGNIAKRGLVWNEEYETRLLREIELIKQKNFEDYFYLVSDMCIWAKQHMLVGPGRGSSAGSLVCYLLYITEVDPIIHKLIFERFIDITRNDTPDIDIDYPDNKRDMVINYLEDKYGKECVAHIGTITRYKPKSAIGEVAKKYGIPAYETNDVKGAIIERSGGDARSAFCIADTFESLDVGKAFIKKYPAMANVSRIEGHARNCVSGENFVSCEHGQHMKVHSLYSIFHPSGQMHRRLKKFDKNIRIRSYDQDKDVLFFDNVVNVHYTGYKETLSISFRGRILRVTPEHLLLDRSGMWKQAKDFKIGDFVSINGVFKKGFTPWNKGTKGLQVAWNKGIPNPEKSEQMKLSNPMKNPETVAKATAHIWKHGANSNQIPQYLIDNPMCEACNLKLSKQVHHLDGNPFNNPKDGSNYKALCVSCHRKIHKTIPTRIVKPDMTIGWGRITNIEVYGFEDVYDIEMESKNHNFVCNKTIVHNSGCHAAGILVCSHDIKDCCSVNSKDNIAQIDKYDAEALNLLKVDMLGLRTLSVLDSCMTYVGKDPKELYDIPLDDFKALSVLNDKRYSGIFQFEGYALQSLSKQMGIQKFDDIVAITSLARPGPLHCGGASAYIERRTGRAEVEYDHIACKNATDETYGVVVFQETVMNIAREVGKLSWEDVCMLRKAMSKSLGDEFFNQYWERFKVGALENGLTEKEARKVWDNMCTFGSWAFCKAHAVSYGLLSYWCAYCKAHYPLEYALACLNNEKDPESTIKILRELVKEGYKFKPFDAKHSVQDWSIYDGVLLGGLTSIKGIGASKAAAIILRRELGLPLLPGMERLLKEGTTPWDNIFETEKRFGDYYRNPEKYGIQSQTPITIDKIDGEGEWVFIGKLMIKNLRDLNEYGSVAKRGGKIIEKNNLFLNLTLADDTDSIICTVNRWKYEKYGKDIVETAKEGDYFLVKGKTQGEWRKIEVEKIRKIG